MLRMPLGRLSAVFGVLVALLALLSSATPAAAVTLDPLQLTWMRADQPVASGLADRTWLWGPQSNAVETRESYAESPAGQREVIYYDKARMELTHPDGDPTSIWHVTNGLLVVELVSGRMQTGDAQFTQRAPAAINVAGDNDDPNGPTYATIATLLSAPPAADGATLTQRVDRAGVVTDDPALSGYGVTAAERVTVPGVDHQVASVFWDFMNSQGLVYQDGVYENAALFENAFYATGYPISEAYWATVQVAGTPQDVLLQCFERRCLTWTPGNAPGWQVEAGNVGLHYYQWRYAAPRPAPETLSVTFNISYGGQQIAQTVTHETFLGNTAVGTWTTTDLAGQERSRGTLIAEHALTGVSAMVTQDWPFAGTGDLTLAYTLALNGVSGQGTLDYTAQTADGPESGSVSFSATSTTLDVWEVTLDALPPVLFTGG